MASIMGTLSTQDVVASAFAKMLLSSPRYASEAQATWAPGINSGRVIALLVVMSVLAVAFILVQIFLPKTATVPPRIYLQRSVFSGW